MKRESQLEGRKEGEVEYNPSTTRFRK